MGRTTEDYWRKKRQTDDQGKRAVERRKRIEREAQRQQERRQ